MASIVHGGPTQCDSEGLISLSANRRADRVQLLRDKNSDCAKFLKQKLGLNGSRVAKAVLGLHAFDGTKSTLSMGDAGLFALGYTDWPQGYLPTDVYFKVDHPYAATATYARGRLRDVYFNPSGPFSGLNASTILHETLHVFLGIGDIALEDRLGKADPDFHAITIALSNAGCK